MKAKLLLLWVFTKYFINAQETEIEHDSGNSFFQDSALQLKEAAKKAGEGIKRGTGDCAELVSFLRDTKLKLRESKVADKVIDDYIIEMQDKSVFKYIDKALHH